MEPMVPQHPAKEWSPNTLPLLETIFAWRWEGVRLPHTFWKLPELPQKFPPAACQELLSPWILREIQRVFQKFPTLPQK